MYSRMAYLGLGTTGWLLRGLGPLSLGLAGGGLAERLHKVNHEVDDMIFIELSGRKRIRSAIAV